MIFFNKLVYLLRFLSVSLTLSVLVPRVVLLL